VQLFNDVKQKAVDLVTENATTLLTAGGVVGTVATAVLTGRATFKAAEIIHSEELKAVHSDKDVTDSIAEGTMGLSNWERTKLVWPLYLPPVLTGTATIGSIIMANRMSAQKAAALAAAYGLAERNLSEYKDKVSEKLTGPKQQQIDDEIAQDRVNRTSGHENIVVVDGEVLCFDEPTGRYFRSTMENIKAAVNATNAEILNADHVNASFFYEELGLPATTWTNDVGWNRDNLLDLKYSTVLTPNDNKPCIAIDFRVLPKQDYIPKHY
jgi:ribosomal protein L18E